MDTRPTFYYKNDQTKPIRAGGVLFFNYKKSNIELLMIKKSSNLKYEDIGGKTSESDKDIYETIAREVSEETNNVINFTIIQKQLHLAKCIYIPHAKYLLFIVKANSFERKLKASHFGNKEIHDDIDRTIEWVNFDDFLDNKLNTNTRLHSYELKGFLYENFRLSSQILKKDVIYNPLM